MPKMNCYLCKGEGFLRHQGGGIEVCKCEKEIAAQEFARNEAEIAARPIKSEWEAFGEMSARMKVFGGWIVNVTDTVGDRENCCFVPDKYHVWNIEE